MPTNPKDCPNAEFHGTHRYCPSCTWTEADDRGPCPSSIDFHTPSVSYTYVCDSYEGHAGDHYAEKVSTNRNRARLTWPRG